MWRENDGSGTRYTLVEKEDGNKHLSSDHHEDQIQYFEKTKLKIIDILSKVAFSYVYSIYSSNTSKRKSLFESTILKIINC